MALTSVDKGMLENNAYDGLGPDHLRFKQNLCGIVMSLDLDSSYSATQAQVRELSFVLGLQRLDNACIFTV
jgi:hypothetical protein